MLSRDTLVVESVSLLRTTPVSFGDAPNSLEGWPFNARLPRVD